MWTVENAAKTLVWTKNFLSVFKKQKTEVFENALVWTGPKMFCVSFVLMKLKSHFIGFPDERSLQRLSVKNTRTFHSLPLYPIVVSICVCSLSGLSQISLNAKIRNEFEKTF